MPHHINYSSIGWEQFEDLCTSLWFGEGYTDIRPYGRRGEGGRDAVYYDESGNLTIFQYKRWTGNYSISDLKSKIKEAANKIKPYSPKVFILNSPLPPNPQINDWIPSLSEEMGFQVEYYDRTWLDLRLDNQRQDLRRDYFGIDLEYQTLESFKEDAQKQVERSLVKFENKYIPELYVERECESRVIDFLASDDLCLALVDRTGRGKTNILCSVALDNISKGLNVLFIDASVHFEDEHSLERLFSLECGYSAGNYTHAIQHITKLVSESESKTIIIIDGLSENNNLHYVGKSLTNFLSLINGTENLKVILAFRDINWNQFQYHIPKKLLHRVRQSIQTQEEDYYAYQLMVNNFTPDELHEAVEKYSSFYNIDFLLSGDASRQLMYPLLLRVFCETYKDSQLGSISTIPIAKTFDSYIDQKIDAIVSQDQIPVTHNDIYYLLLELASIGILQGSGQNLLEDSLPEILPGHIDLPTARSILLQLESEGIIEIRTRPLSPRRSIHFVFDELQDYLTLLKLISNTPESIRKDIEERNTIDSLIRHIAEGPINRITVHFASLIGMVMPDIPGRESNLTRLQNWNFYSYCNCLKYIPPSGNLHECTSEAQYQLSSQLLIWYRTCAFGNFQQVVEKIDPFYFSELSDYNADSLGIDLITDTHCRQIKYQYKILNPGEDTIKSSFTEEYPVWKITLSSGDTELSFPDPEHGITISAFRKEGPGGNVIRTLDLPKYPSFPGQSLNIPERIAVHDLLNELINMVDNDRYAYHPIFMITERIISIAKDFPLLGQVEDLTLNKLLGNYDAIMSQYVKNSREYVLTSSQLYKLQEDLITLNDPVTLFDYPKPDKKIDEDSPNRENDYTDDQLCLYISKIIVESWKIYHSLVDSNFPEIKDHMSLYQHYPFIIRIITNREIVRFVFIPIEDEEKTGVSCEIVPKETIDIGDPSIEIKVDDQLFHDFCLEKLKLHGRHIQPVKPIEESIPIEDLFSETPMNNLAKGWIKRELIELFGF